MVSHRLAGRLAPAEGSGHAHLCVRQCTQVGVCELEYSSTCGVWVSLSVLRLLAGSI